MKINEKVYSQVKHCNPVCRELFVLLSQGKSEHTIESIREELSWGTARKKKYSENQIREALKTLQEIGLIDVNYGRQKKMIISLLFVLNSRNKTGLNSRNKSATQDTENTGSSGNEKFLNSRNKTALNSRNKTVTLEVLLLNTKTLLKDHTRETVKSTQNKYVMWAFLFFEHFYRTNPTFVNLKKAKILNWSQTVKLMFETDERTKEDLTAILEFLKSDSEEGIWWNTTIYTVEGVRKNFDQIIISSKKSKKKDEPVAAKKKNYLDGE